MGGCRILEISSDWEIIMKLSLPFFAMILKVGPAWAYEEVQVLNGGAKFGKVIIKGEKPRAMAFNLVTILDFRNGIGGSSDYF